MSARVDGGPGRLFTPTFFTMCAFTFTVFISAFQLFPTAPIRILALGGGTVQAGLFLGILTYLSAFTAPVTGAIADLVGKRRVLFVASLGIALLSLLYAFATAPWMLLLIVAMHGVLWSGLLSSSAAFMADALPEARRAEGIAYWGIATTLAIALAPPLGLWLYAHGWLWLCGSIAGLNLVMTLIAYRLPQQPGAELLGSHSLRLSALVEWRIMALAFTLFLCSFGYGGATSFVALFSKDLGVEPQGIFFTVFGIVTLVTRLLFGRLADRVGYRRFLLPCLALVSVGFALLATARSRAGIVIAAAVFALGFGNMYPAFAAHALRGLDPRRRGAAFGGILAAFDTGIGSGSIVLGWIIGHAGYRWAFGVATALAACAVPYFVWAEPRLGSQREAVADPPLS